MLEAIVISEHVLKALVLVPRKDSKERIFQVEVSSYVRQVVFCCSTVVLREKATVRGVLSRLDRSLFKIVVGEVFKRGTVIILITHGKPMGEVLLGNYERLVLLV